MALDRWQPPKCTTGQGMRGRPLEDCEDALGCLVFLQEVVACALWEHGASVSESLEAFARGFDRLDVPSELERLHDRAQAR